jgi:hypothetical protein
MSTTDSVELLEAVRQFLREEVLPELDGFKSYNTRVAASALGIVAREIQLGEGIAQLDAEIATALGLDPQSGPVTRQIALALRDGALQPDSRLLTYLRQRSMRQIEIDNPKYSGLQQGRALWED